MGEDDPHADGGMAQAIDAAVRVGDGVVLQRRLLHQEIELTLDQALLCSQARPGTCNRIQFTAIVRGLVCSAFGRVTVNTPSVTSAWILSWLIRVEESEKRRR